MIQWPFPGGLGECAHVMLGRKSEACPRDRSRDFLAVSQSRHCPSTLPSTSLAKKKERKTSANANLPKPK